MKLYGSILTKKLNNPMEHKESKNQLIRTMQLQPVSHRYHQHPYHHNTSFFNLRKQTLKMLGIKKGTSSKTS